MTATGFFVKNAQFEKQMQENPEVGKKLLPLAEAAKSVAESLAPVRLGHYKSSFKAMAGKRPDGKVVARLASFDFKAHWIELGTGPPIPTPPMAVLRTAAEQTIGRVE